MSVVFADSSCDLSAKELKKIGIECINIKFELLGKKIIYKADNFNFEEYYSNSHTEVINVTNLSDFKKPMMDAVNTGQDVVVLTPSAKYFSSHALANNAKSEIIAENVNANINIINTESFSVGYASIVYLAGILNSKGISSKELDYSLKKLINSTELLVIPDKIDNAILGSNLPGGLIGAKSIINFVHEKPKVLTSIKGKVKLFNEIISAIKFSGYNIADYPVGIAHGKNMADSELLNKKINDEFKDINIWVKPYNPLITNLFGLNSMLICYHNKNNNLFTPS